MAPGVLLTICATPPLPLPPCALEGQLMVELVPSFQTLAAPSVRAREKFAVVPEESERTARLIGVLGRFTPGLSALIAGSFQVLILPRKLFAMVGTSSFSLLTPARLYDIAIGPRRTGQDRTVLPRKFPTSADGSGEREP